MLLRIRTNSLLHHINTIQTQRITSMKYTAVLGRVLYSAIFILAGFGHFSSQTIAYATGAGVPFAGLAVPLSGIMAIVGGLSIALGYKARWGGVLVSAFLIPVTIMMHNFWAITDPTMAMMQRAMFMKNLALLGGSLYFAAYGVKGYALDQVFEHQPIRTNKPIAAV